MERPAQFVRRRAASSAGKVLHVGGLQVVGHDVPGGVEPEVGHLGEDPALVGDAVGHDAVEGRDAVGGHQQQAVAQVVDVADLAAAEGGEGQAGGEQGGHGRPRSGQFGDVPGGRREPMQPDGQELVAVLDGDPAGQLDLPDGAPGAGDRESPLARRRCPPRRGRRPAGRAGRPWDRCSPWAPGSGSGSRRSPAAPKGWPPGPVPGRRPGAGRDRPRPGSGPGRRPGGPGGARGWP